MFDIGFWEITLIAVIALIVVGPDRFPGMVRTLGLWLGRARQFASNIKHELDIEMNKAEELKHLLEEQKEIVQRHELIEEDFNESSDDAKPKPIPAKNASNTIKAEIPDQSIVNKNEKDATSVSSGNDKSQ